MCLIILHNVIVSLLSGKIVICILCLQVYDGASEKSDILENVISIAGDGVKSQEGTVLGNSYHLLVLFTKHSQDDQAQLRAAFVSKGTSLDIVYLLPILIITI